MAATTSYPSAPVLAGQRPQAPGEHAAASQPVLWWAIVGAVFFAFSGYLIISWIAGPYFHSVASGPDRPPAWMRAVQISWMAIGIPLTVLVIYKVLIAPWRREGRPSTDGLMALSCLLLVVQDPWSSYVQHWFTYNSWLPNMGSWVNEIPGWIAFGAPGAQVPEPILWSPFMYCYAFFAITVLGSAMMRKAKRRWPALGPIRLVGLCIVFMFVIDFVLEGALFLPLGFYSYAGGHWAIFPDAYHKFPAHEAVFAGTMFAVMSSVRYFVDDKGNSVAERGIDTVRGGAAKKSALRFLAIFGIFSSAVLACYNVPSAIMAANSTRWPADVQKRSYLTDRICGAGTDRACPGPGVPITRGEDSIHLAPNGELVVPSGAKAPRVVPFSNAGSGPFNGGVF
jgi:hypothetical protein